MPSDFQIFIDLFVGGDHACVGPASHRPYQDYIGLVGIAHQNILHILYGANWEPTRKMCVDSTCSIVCKCCVAENIEFLHLHSTYLLWKVHTSKVETRILEGLYV